MNELKEQNETTQSISEQMPRKKGSRKDRIKNIAIVFLAVLLVFTFFSNTIMNRSLPEVSGQYAGSGTISTSIRGTGTVTANMAYSVQIDSTRQIRAVYVKSGDTVEAGQVIFALEDADSQELKDARQALRTAQQELQTMQYNYSVKLLENLPPDYASSNQEIANLQADLAAAIADQAAVAGSNARLDGAKLSVRSAEDQVARINDQITAIDDEITRLNGEIGAINETIASVQGGEIEDYPSLVSARANLTLAQTAQNLAQTAYDTASEAVTALESGAAPGGSAASMTAEQRTLEDLELQLEQMQEDYQRLLRDQEAYNRAVEAVNDAQDEVTWFSNSRDYLNAKRDYEAALAEFSAYQGPSVTDSAATTDAESEPGGVSITTPTANYNLLDDPVYIQLKQALDSTKNDYDYYENQLTALKNQLTAAQETLQSLNPVTESQLIAAEREIEQQEIAIQRQREDMGTMQQDIATAAAQNLTIQQARDRQTAAKDSLDNAKASVNAAQIAYDNAVNQQVHIFQNQIRTLQADISAQQSLRTSANQSLRTAQRALEDAQEAYSDLQTDAAQEESLSDTITSLQRSLSTAVAAQASQQQQDNVSGQIADLELEQDQLHMQQQELVIQEQEAIVAELEAANTDTAVTARYAGTITTVAVVAGDTAAPGQELAAIDVEGKGYTLTISVTAEQSRQVHVGDHATVGNYWWGDLDVELTAIKPDPSNPGQSKLLEFTVSGDVSEGQSLELSIGERQTRYDLVVPNSAIREDTNGTFILVATSKSTPLATRYTATRVNVTVIAKDSYNTAIDAGSDYGYEYVITTATKPLEPGSQIRLVNG